MGCAPGSPCTYSGAWSHSPARQFLALAVSTLKWLKSLEVSLSSHNGDLLLHEPFSLLTCWDSLAAAAASPVSMEATLVPSRTGLSCLGTDGPTLAVEETRERPVNQLCKWPTHPRPSLSLGGHEHLTLWMGRYTTSTLPKMVPHWSIYEAVWEAQQTGQRKPGRQGTLKGGHA